MATIYITTNKPNIDNHYDELFPEIATQTVEVCEVPDEDVQAAKTYFLKTRRRPGFEIRMSQSV